MESKCSLARLSKKACTYSVLDWPLIAGKVGGIAKVVFLPKARWRHEVDLL